MTAKTRAKVKFTGSTELLAKLQARRPDLVARSRNAPLREVVGRNLLRLRTESGLSRRALAERTVEVGERTIQRIEEAGEDSNPTVRVLEELAKALRVAATDLTDPGATLLGESPRRTLVPMAAEGDLGDWQVAAIAVGLRQAKAGRFADPKRIEDVFKRAKNSKD